MLDVESPLPSITGDSSNKNCNSINISYIIDISNDNCAPSYVSPYDLMKRMTEEADYVGLQNSQHPKLRPPADQRDFFQRGTTQ